MSSVRQLRMNVSRSAGIDAIVAVAAGRFRQQAFALVVADGLDLAVGDFRQFSDLHGAASENRCLTL
jgi:hypothetical protein